MIKYITKTGAGSAMDQKARMMRDGLYKDALSGMYCRKCNEDTKIVFTQHTGFAGSSSLDVEIKACCPEFRQQIRDRLS